MCCGVEGKNKPTYPDQDELRRLATLKTAMASFKLPGGEVATAAAAAAAVVFGVVCLGCHRGAQKCLAGKTVTSRRAGAG